NAKMNQSLRIKAGNVTLDGELALPGNAKGLVIFSHGSGSSRFSPRNNFVAQHFRDRGFGTFLFDLLTREEDEHYDNRFNIDLLSGRLVEVTNLVCKLPSVQDLPTGFFGASTGAASAIVAASELKDHIKAIVSRGGRPDLAMGSLALIKSPILLIVGSLDDQVLLLNRQALENVQATKSLKIVDGATHLFEEPGKLEEVALLSGDWFEKYLVSQSAFHIQVNKGT
ncbi:MAG TPA: dienelactone hydrolase family protein, partial [Chryseosolibacter sp.]|nr:dienelactone hydrolase family protein [Chryseosolibacter sp.]